MTPATSRSISTRRILAAGISCLLAAASAPAATFTWDGGSATTSNWNDAANWVGDVLPVDVNSTDLLYVGSAAQLTSTNSVNDFNVRNIIFDPSATSYTIHSNTNVGTLLSLGTGGIVQNSNAEQFFTFGTGSSALRIDQGSPVITGTGTGALTIGATPGSGTVNSRTGTPFSLVVSNGPFEVLINSNITNGSGTFTVAKQNTGTLRLTGTVSNNGGFAVNGGSLVLDYATLATGNRANDAAGISFGGGDLRLLGNDSAALVETVAAVTVGAQGGELTLVPGAGQTATFTGASLTRTASTGTILFRGTNLGGTTGQFSQILFSSLTGLVGGAGAAGTPQISIIPFAIGDTSVDGGGRGLVTYDPVAGARLLNEATEFAPYATAAANDNAAITVGGTVTGSAAINSLLLKNTIGSAMTVTIADGTNLAPASGTFLFSGDAANPITVTRDTGGAGDGAINLAANVSANVFVTAGTSATIAAPIRLDTTGALAKDGAGTLILNQNLTTTGFASTATAVIAVNGGTLRSGAANIVGIGRTDGALGYTPSLVLAEGATWDINGFNQAFNGKGSLGGTFGSIVTNTGANAVISPLGPSNNNGSGTASTFNGTFTDGTPLDGAATGLISLDVAANSSNNGTGTMPFGHGGHTFNNITVRTLSSDQAALTLTSLSPADHNTIHGSITLGQGTSNTNSRSTLTAVAAADGNNVSRTLDTAPILITSTTGGVVTAGTLNVRVQSMGAPLTEANTTTWTNDVTFSGSKTNATITLDRGGTDGLSANFTHQLDTLTLSGATRNLTVTASNGTKLEFTGTTTLNHSAATTDTLTVSAGTLKLNGVAEDGIGAKSLTKAGTGTLILDDLITHTGSTTVSAGTLLVTGAITGSTGASVSANATLGGTGTLAPTGPGLSVALDGIVAPGVGGIGTLTVNSASTEAASVANFASGAKFTFELNSGSQSDRLAFTSAVAGDVAFGGNTVNFSDLSAGSLNAGPFTLFTADTVAAYTGLTLDGGNFITAGLVIGTGLEAYEGANLQVVGNDIVLNVVPEPASAVMLASGLGILLGLQRFRRRA